MDIPSIQPKTSVMPFEQMAANKSIPEKEKVKEACRQFEAVLLRQILGEARKTVIKSPGSDDNSNTAGIYNDMVNNQMADSISQSGAFGLAKSLQAQLVHQVLPKTAASATTATATTPTTKN
jgi:Rod binding domain-containing protein